MANGGLYLSSFADNFLRARAAEEARNRAAGSEAADIFSTERYLEELGREREAREETLPAMLAQRRGRMARPPAFSPVAPDVPLPAGQPAMFRPSPLAAGGVAALEQPPRPAVAETLLGALDPKQQARFLTSRTGRAVMPTLEASERERRQEEDRQEAEAFFTQGQEAFRGGDTAGGLDHFAAGLRRVGNFGAMAQYMQLAAKTRADKQEEERAAEDAKGIIPALDAFDADPTAKNLAAVSGAQANAKSLAWRQLNADFVQNRLKKALAGDRDEEAFLRAAITSQDPPDKAWADAARQYPQGLFKIMSRQLLSGKAELPDELWDVMRLTKPAGKDASLALRARQQTLLEANAARRAGAPWTPMQFQQRWNDTIVEMERREAEAKRSPEAKAIEKDRAAILKMRREAMERPESLDKKSAPELTLLIQRTARDLETIVDPEEEREAKDYLKLLREARNRKGGAEGPKVAPSVDVQAEYNRLRKRGLTPEKARDDLKRRGLLD